MTTVRYMEHPSHGRMPVYTPEEVKRHEAIGWKVIDLDAPKELAAKQEATDEMSRAALIAAYTEKFGEKPHHRKSDETLRRELGDRI